MNIYRKYQRPNKGKGKGKKGKKGKQFEDYWVHEPFPGYVKTKRAPAPFTSGQVQVT